MSDTHASTTSNTSASPLIPEHIRSIVLQPPLLRGECAEDYERLLELHAAERNPKTVTDWILLTEEVNKIWEYARFERMARGVIDKEVPAVIETAIEPLADRTAYFSPDQIRRGTYEVACGMLLGKTEDRDAILRLLKANGVTLDWVYARANLRKTDDVSWLRQQAQRARADIRKIKGDQERQRFALTQRPQAKADDVVDIDFKEAA